MANKNDTNGNATPDNGEDPVTGEKDLMKLQIVVIPPKIYGTTATLLVDGLVAIWKKSNKEGIEEIINGKIELPVDPNKGLNETRWVEAVTESGTLRDISLTLIYDGATDVAKATGVWAKVTDVRHNYVEPAKEGKKSKPKNDPLYGWIDFKDPVSSTFNTTDKNWGLIPIPSPTNGVYNSIGLEFTVYPHDVGKERGVKFDITRRIEFKQWKVAYIGGVEYIYESDGSFPPDNEAANDDENDIDESATVENDHMYSIDAPGLPIYHAFYNLSVARMNSEEFMRVRFDDVRPTGGGDGQQGHPPPKIDGSSCSDKKPWHYRHYLTNRDGIWVRTSEKGKATKHEDKYNDIDIGHIEIGETYEQK